MDFSFSVPLEQLLIFKVNIANVDKSTNLHVDASTNLRVDASTNLQIYM